MIMNVGKNNQEINLRLDSIGRKKRKLNMKAAITTVTAQKYLQEQGQMHFNQRNKKVRDLKIMTQYVNYVERKRKILFTSQ